MQGLKMLVVIYSGPEPDRVTAILDAHPVGGYTLFGEVHGVGATGRRGGSRAWPGQNSLVMSVMDEACLASVVPALRDAARELPAGQRLHVAVLPVEAFG